jgi:streptogramin lyase
VSTRVVPRAWWLAALLCVACSGERGTSILSPTSAISPTESTRQQIASVTPSTGRLISINAGGTAVGNFVADTDYVDGTTSFERGNNVVIDTSAANAAPAAVYTTYRDSAGSFSYVYKAAFVPGQPAFVRLHFAEVLGLHAGQRQFNVAVNYAPALTNFDIFAEAGDKDNKAVVVDVPFTPDASGTVTITFSPGAAGDPIVEGLEIYGVAATPGTLSAPTSVLINSGGPATGNFSSDTFVDGLSEPGSDNATIDVSGPNTAPAAVYATYRTEPKTVAYLVTGLAPNAPFSGFLHFEEPVYGAVGKRVMAISVGGTYLTTKFDIYATAGDKLHKAVALPMTVTSNASGEIPILITGLNGAPAIISGFELHAGSSASPSPSPTTTPLIAINAGGPELDGFSANEYESGGTNETDTVPVNVSATNLPLAAIFATYTEGSNFNYTIPNLVPNTAYHGSLYFEEPSATGPGQRVMQIEVNGTIVESALDIYASAGATHKAIAVPFDTTSDALGAIQIALQSTPPQRPSALPAILSAFTIDGPANPNPPSSSGPVAAVFTAGFSSGSDPYAITAGPDGNLWITEDVGNRIARVTPSGTVTEFSAGISAGSSPEGIAKGPDGNLWFTEPFGNRIGRITPTGTVTEFGLGPASIAPFNITAGPDGNLWFTTLQCACVGRIAPSGTVTYVPTGNSYGPRDIVTGPDGSLWVTETASVTSGAIARITTSGNITQFTSGLSGAPANITAGSDGNLWFSETGFFYTLEGVRTAYTPPEIGRITTAGAITEFSTYTFGGAGPIATGPDGNVWFSNGGAIGRISPSGIATSYSSSSSSTWLAAGPSDTLWYTIPQFPGPEGVGRLSL